MSKIPNLSPSVVFFQAPNTPKHVFGRGSGASLRVTTLLRTPLLTGGTLFHTFSCGASVLRPLSRKIPGCCYASGDSGHASFIITALWQRAYSESSDVAVIADRTGIIAVISTY